MRRRTTIRLAPLIVVVLLLSSCASMMQTVENNPKAVLGSVLGAAAVLYFDIGRAVIGPDGQRELRWFLGKMQPYAQAVMLVQGFADATGIEAKNRSLSEDRARAVTTFLNAAGIGSARIVMQGYGTESPAASNVTAQGRRNNRRVEVTVR